MEIFDDSNQTSHSSNLESEDMELNQTQNNSLSEDNGIPRAIIPIGPRFQAEVPKWEDSTNEKCHNNDDDLKWLGIQVWPVSNISENSTKGIGEGRPDSCYCKNLGSIECVKLHIREAKELLKLEIGATIFSSWKFDEMREEVSKSWILEEDKEFESLLELNTSSTVKNLWKPYCFSMETRSLQEVHRVNDKIRTSIKRSYNQI
ncbi:AT-rich interactive domain-containing protein 2-like [Vigna umbellata]|uniref:AT-rich interactive domain-containing protein 2-like n=1 Tax=Vigna umbellata TaxID=87088 RepID=UPI001F5ECA06|nr:AT-rich interactive domain-containing protein 2-like [Vigna umbellata]